MKAVTSRKKSESRRSDVGDRKERVRAETKAKTGGVF
jgi:hypothetical protein